MLWCDLYISSSGQDSYVVSTDLLPSCGYCVHQKAINDTTCVNNCLETGGNQNRSMIAPLDMRKSSRHSNICFFIKIIYFPVLRWWLNFQYVSVEVRPISKLHMHFTSYRNHLYSCFLLTPNPLEFIIL